jgi:hypothetical protein
MRRNEMLYRRHSGWALGVLMALALGAVAAPAVTAARSKEKVVHHTGIVTGITPGSIRLQERHFLMRRVSTYPLSTSPTVQLAKGGTGSMADVVVGSKVTLTGTQGPDKKVIISEIQVLAPPKRR